MVESTIELICRCLIKNREKQYLNFDRKKVGLKKRLRDIGPGMFFHVNMK